MSRSPVQIVEIIYPALSYEANLDADANKLEPNIPITFNAGVRFDKGGVHVVRLSVEQSAVSVSIPYTVDLQAFASFKFDKEDAKKFYGSNIIEGIAINVVSIIFSAVREAVANLTARGPYGSAYIEGVVIDTSNIEVIFNEDPRKLLPKLFDMEAPTDDDVKAMKNAALHRIEESATVKSRKKSAKAAKKVSKKE